MADVLPTSSPRPVAATDDNDADSKQRRMDSARVQTGARSVCMTIMQPHVLMPLLVLAALTGLFVTKAHHAAAHDADAEAAYRNSMHFREHTDPRAQARRRAADAAAAEALHAAGGSAAGQVISAAEARARREVEPEKKSLPPTAAPSPKDTGGIPKADLKAALRDFYNDFDPDKAEEDNLEHIVHKYKALDIVQGLEAKYGREAIPAALEKLLPAAPKEDLWGDRCFKFEDCEACVENGCGWCIGQAWCVQDKANICDDAMDHIGEASGNTVCPVGIRSAKDAESKIKPRS